MFKKLYFVAAFVLAFNLCAYAAEIDYSVYGSREGYYYQNGALLNNSDNLDYTGDVKTILPSENVGREVFTNYPEGYSVTFPSGMKYDFSLSQYVTTVQNSDFYCELSLEKSPYDDLWGYIDYYQNRFYTDQNYIEKNGFKLCQNEKLKLAGIDTQIITLSSDTPINGFKLYTFAYQDIGGGSFMRYLFKGSGEFDEYYRLKVNDVLDSYKRIDVKGSSVNLFNAAPKPCEYWNDETANVYQKYLSQDTIDWGVFTADVYNTGIDKTIPELEQKLEANFDIVLMYRQFGDELPLESIKKVYDSGKIVELTIQTSYKNNEDVFGYTPMFDLANGNFDDDIRKLANQIKSIEHTVLFRLNNEMNTDWTSYSGIVNLSDADIFKSVWKRIYDIFIEEGVDNTIWIWNANNKDYPPTKWNSFLRYYPGDDYVHIIGVTGYNTGNYYKDVTGERWQSFTEIYDEIYKKYSDYFGEFPWIITEFACSSYGGDKPQWITSMFKNIHKYNNIKAAVWFSHADYDYREGNTEIPSRPYWIDETEHTLEAFKEGMAEN